MSSQQQLTALALAREVVEVPVAEEMSQSFLAYGLSVITARAIPDVRDGLKPVQRRILWSMLQMGVRPGTPYRKSARIVGDTMGRYHPHGDAAVYDTLVRLGQDFSRMVPMVDPQGNFGSLDDPPAAARYTECRLTQAAMDMVSELDEQTVDFRPTYDGEGTEPTVLPAALPNLMVNGTTGIAVGMATNMAPHNLKEIGAAIELVMRRQERGEVANTDELLKVVPGPDFPGGGLVVDEGLRRVYETGRGRVRVRARVSLEKVTRLRRAVIVTELPYLVGPERVVAKVTQLASAGRLDNVVGITDLSDMEGLRIRIDLKLGARPGEVLGELHRLTPLEETFAVNNVVLVDGVPTTVGLRAMCEHYISHRLDVIERRTAHRLEKARRRRLIVDGLIIAVDNIDEVVALIRGSKSPAAARDALMARFELVEIQAVHILNMRLRRLTALEKQKLLDEAEALRASIGDYVEILENEHRRRDIVRGELRRVVEDHGRPRRSRIVSKFEADTDLGDEWADGVADSTSASGGDGATESPSRRVPVHRDVACVVTVSTTGNLGRTPVTASRWASTGQHDLLACRAITSTGSPLALVTSQGRVFTVRAGEAAEASNRLRGASVAPMLGLDKTERVLALVTESDEKLLTVTKTGMVKRLRANEVLAIGYGESLIDLTQGDQVAAAFMVPDASDLVIVADDAKALRVRSADLSLSGRPGGAIGMRLADGVSVSGAGIASDDGVLVMATNVGGLKSTALREIPVRRRSGRGMLAAKLANGENVTAVAVVANADADLRALKSRDDNPRLIDPRPVPVRIEVTKRYSPPALGGRRIRMLALGRW